MFTIMFNLMKLKLVLYYNVLPFIFLILLFLSGMGTYVSQKKTCLIILQAYIRYFSYKIIWGKGEKFWALLRREITARLSQCDFFFFIYIYLLYQCTYVFGA